MSENSLLEQDVTAWRDRLAAVKLTRPEGDAALRRALDLLGGWLEALDDHRDDPAIYEEVCRVVFVGFRSLLVGVSCGGELMERVGAPVVANALKTLKHYDLHTEEVKKWALERYGDTRTRNCKIRRDYLALCAAYPDKPKAAHQRKLAKEHGLSLPRIKQIIFEKVEKAG